MRAYRGRESVHDMCAAVFESNLSSHRIADLLQEDVVVAKSLVGDHHSSPRSALIKIVVKK